MRQARSTRFFPFIAIAVALAVPSQACHDGVGPAPNAGPDGGRLELANGSVILEIPSGALDGPVEITATLASDAPQSPRLLGGTAFEFGPDGLQFAVPVTLALRFDPAQLPSDILPPELRVHRATGGAWDPLAESSVDQAANQVSGMINGFSTYGVLGVAVSAISVSPSDVLLMPKSTRQLTATPLDAQENVLPERAVSWSTSDESVATIDDTGLITAVDVGATSVTAASEGVETMAAITVAEANAGPDGGQLVLADGSIVLDIPAGALDQPVLISTVPAAAAPPAPSLVMGSAHALRPDGLMFSTPATLTVTYDPVEVPEGIRTSELRLYRAGPDTWNEIEGSMPVSGVSRVAGPIDGFSVFAVLGIPVASIELSETDVELAPDETLQLTATARDADQNALPDRIVTWESNDTDVATVSPDGLVTARAAGSAAVTATSENVDATAGITVVSADAQPGIEIVASGLTQPVFVTSPPGDMQRVFIVEQPGTIRILRNGSVLQTPFLDIEDAVGCCGERGLLSLAFHPQYASNGIFFVYYTNNQGNTRVVRYTVSANPDVADDTSGDTVLTVAQPFPNHNGGLLAFGPNGFLHVGLGDGGSGGDPDGNGQDSTTLLGSLLRIDVNGVTPYEIPEDNPLIERPNARPEIWAYGLRNPWRYSFDRMTGDLYIADVGQGQWEEVNVQLASSEGGENYGWNVMEGAHCYNAQSCDQTGLVLPVHEYPHSQGCSITGGYVYRGSVFPGLQGTYFYTDYCVGVIRSFRYENGGAVDHRDWSAEFGGSLGNVTSFGEDAAGELYVTTSNGNVHKIVPN